MKIKFFLLAVGLLFGKLSMAQSADDVINKYYDAIGGKALLKKVQTVHTSMKGIQGPMEFPMEMVQARPNKMHMKITIQGSEMIQGFDGETGWAANPFGTNKDPQPATPEQNEDMKKQASIDGELMNYAENGSKAEYLGKDEMEGTEVHKVKLTEKDGDVQTYFFDAASHMLLRTESKNMIEGKEITSSMTFGDYRDVSGLKFPFLLVAGSGGEDEEGMGFTMKIDKMEINREGFDQSIFSMPKK